MAWWNATTRSATCEQCATTETPAADQGPQEPSGPGASAQREAGRRRDRREREIRAAHPRIGGLIHALSEEPQSTRAWERGAEGERRLGAGLDRLAANGVLVLHDRRRPGTRANIDHIAVAASGVWIIDAKRYRGRVERRDAGGWFSRDERLYVAGRDRTPLTEAMGKQRTAVVEALGDDLTDVPLHTALCFIESDWRLFAKPFSIDGALITWPKALYERLTADGAVTPDRCRRLAEQLDMALPASL
jgi:hypothetical protein